MSLASGQVHQVQLALLERRLLGRRVGVDALDPDGEDGVRARRVGVHARRGCHSALDALAEQVRAVPDRLNVVHREVWKEIGRI